MNATTLADAQSKANPWPAPLQTTEQHTPTKYRLAADKAAVIRTNPPAILTTWEAAAYVGVSPRKLRDLIAEGRLKCARLGSKILIRREYLDELVKVA